MWNNLRCSINRQKANCKGATSLIYEGVNLLPENLKPLNFLLSCYYMYICSKDLFYYYLEAHSFQSLWNAIRVKVEFDKCFQSQKVQKFIIRF